MVDLCQESIRIELWYTVPCKKLGTITLSRMFATPQFTFATLRSTFASLLATFDLHSSLFFFTFIYWNVIVRTVCGEKLIIVHWRSLEELLEMSNLRQKLQEFHREKMSMYTCNIDVNCTNVSMFTSAAVVVSSCAAVVVGRVVHSCTGVVVCCLRSVSTPFQTKYFHTALTTCSVISQCSKQQRLQTMSTIQL